MGKKAMNKWSYTNNQVNIIINEETSAVLIIKYSSAITYLTQFSFSQQSPIRWPSLPHLRHFTSLELQFSKFQSLENTTINLLLKVYSINVNSFTPQMSCHFGTSKNKEICNCFGASVFLLIQCKTSFLSASYLVLVECYVCFSSELTPT